MFGWIKDTAGRILGSNGGPYTEQPLEQRVKLEVAAALVNERASFPDSASYVSYLNAVEEAVAEVRLQEEASNVSGGENRDDVYIEELSDGYRVFNVSGSPITIPGPLIVEVSKELLAGGQSLSQNEHMRRQNNGDYGKWKLGAADVQFLLDETVLNHYNTSENAEQKALAKVVLDIRKDDYVKSWMMTSTRPEYRKRKMALVKHDWNTPEERVIKTDLAGDSGYITEMGCDSALGGLLGIDDIQRVHNVYASEELGGKNAYLFRLGKNSSEERAVVLGFYYVGWFGISAGGVIIRPARGVVATRVKNSSRK